MNGNKREAYSMVFQQCGVGSVIAERFFVPGFEGYLPFVISGDDVNRMKNGQKVELTEQQLLFGILLALYEMEQSHDHFLGIRNESPHLVILIRSVGEWLSA